MVNTNDGFKWGIIPKIVPDLDAARESLYQYLSRTKRVESRPIQLVTPLIGNNFIGDQFFTNGNAYIIPVR